MIQRKQTIFLLISLILLVTAYFLPLASFESAQEIISIAWLGIENQITGEKYLETFPLIGLLLGSVCFTTSSILLFKNRKLQMRLSVYSIIILLGLTFLIGYYSWSTNQVLNEANPNGVVEFKIKFAAIIPLICSILNYLAFRNILKDELLLRSVDRLR